MSKTKGKIVIDIERCKGCQVCLSACPFGVIATSKNVNKKGFHFTETINEECTGCTNCAVMCPDGVITVYRLKKDQ